MIVNRLIGALGYTPTVASAWNIANPAGVSNGTAVTVSLANAFVDTYGVGTLPANNNGNGGAYTVVVTPSQACAVSVSSKTASGFIITLTPPSGVTLAAGTFDVLVHS